MSGTFEVYQDRAGKYRFRLRASSGQIVATSPIKDSWDTPAEAAAHVRTVQADVRDATIEESGA